MDLERNLAEMAQGVLVSQRYARRAQLDRWEVARKIYLKIVNTTWRVWLYQEYGVLLAECEDSSDFPTEAFVAQVALGIQALSSFEGVKEPEQREKSESAKQVIDWKKWAPA